MTGLCCTLELEVSETEGTANTAAVERTNTTAADNRMTAKLNSKLPDVGTTIFTVMSTMAQDYGAINLSQGFPDFEPDAELLERVGYYLHNGKNQYPPMGGVPQLRRAIADKLRRTIDAGFDPDTEITVTSGATEALFCAIHAVVRAGDEVIVFDPAYDSYRPAVELAGGKTVHLPLAPPDYRIDWQALQQKLNPRTRLIIVNTPHNPTGTLLQRADQDRLAALIAAYDCYVLSDEVYEHIIFDQQQHASVLAHPTLRARSFAAFSFGKTYHATGWKVGYCVAPAELSAELRKIHQFNTFTTVTPIQWALADFLASHPQNYLQLAEFYQRKRDLFAALVKPSRFKLLPSQGSYFQLADYSAISSLPDREFAEYMTQEKGVAVIPLSAFYQRPVDTHIIRFCFAKQDDTLKQAAELICRI